MTTLTIPQTFTTRGYTHRLIEQLGNAGLYEQTHDVTGRVMAYEVHAIRFSTADYTFPNGTITPAGSPLLAGNNEWGRRGWTYSDIDAARRRLRAVAGR